MNAKKKKNTAVWKAEFLLAKKKILQQDTLTPDVIKLLPVQSSNGTPHHSCRRHPLHPNEHNAIVYNPLMCFSKVF
jgi:hypothetical protein